MINVNDDAVVLGWAMANRVKKWIIGVAYAAAASDHPISRKYTQLVEEMWTSRLLVEQNKNKKKKKHMLVIFLIPKNKQQKIKLNNLNFERIELYSIHKSKKKQQHCRSMWINTIH